MAFGGAPALVALGQNVIKVQGTLSLGANAGPFDPTGVAVDSGLITTDLTTTPGGAVTLPTTFGPGEGNWTQADVDAVTVVVNDQAPIPTGLVYIKLLVGGNLVIGVHSRAAPAVVIDASIDAQHTATR
jgi:hypothetical protein